MRASEIISNLQMTLDLDATASTNSSQSVPRRLAIGREWGSPSSHRPSGHGARLESKFARSCICDTRPTYYVFRSAMSDLEWGGSNSAWSIYGARVYNPHAGSYRHIRWLIGSRGRYKNPALVLSAPNETGPVFKGRICFEIKSCYYFIFSVIYY